MNDLYRNELRLFMSLFMPSMKQIRKERVGSKPKRQHNNPMAPLAKLIASGKNDPAKLLITKKSESFLILSNSPKPLKRR